MEQSINVLGGPLQPCSTRPMTGFYRNGCCDTGPEDRGSHTVCVVLTDEFLAMSRYLGNDLTTPRPDPSPPSRTGSAPTMSSAFRSARPCWAAP